jgi:hypothetical protein
VPGYCLHNPVADDLVKLAGGDLDLVRRAIDAAAAGKGEADLLDVVKFITGEAPGLMGDR